MRCLALCAQPLTLSSVALVELSLGPPVRLATWSSIWHRSADVLPLPPRPMLLLVLLGAPFSSASTLQTGLSGPSYMLGRCSVGLFLRSRSKRDAVFDMISKVWQLTYPINGIKQRQITQDQITNQATGDVSVVKSLYAAGLFTGLNPGHIKTFCDDKMKAVSITTCGTNYKLEYTEDPVTIEKDRSNDEFEEPKQIQSTRF